MIYGREYTGKGRGFVKEKQGNGNRMHPEQDFKDAEIKRRYKLYYGEESKAEVRV